MNIVYFGTDVFIDCFRFLAEKNNILALYTYHNDEDYFTEYEITAEAEKLGIPVHYEKITVREIAEYFNEKNCDLLFIAEYCSILDIPDGVKSFRGINIHSSRLPEGRSYYPIECAMERELTETGVTMHKLSPVLDAGEILFSERIEIGDGADSIDVYLRSAALALEMTKKLAADIDGVFASGRGQTEKLPYWKRPADEKLLLSHGMTAVQAKEVFRKYNKMTEAVIDGEKYFVSSLMTGTAKLPHDTVRVAEDRYLYRVKDGNLRLTVDKNKN